MSEFVWILLGQCLLAGLIVLFWFFPRVDVDCPYRCPIRRRSSDRRWARLVKRINRLFSKPEPTDFPF
jgi:hypothetical protein